MPYNMKLKIIIITSFDKANKDSKTIKIKKNTKKMKKKIQIKHWNILWINKKNKKKKK